ncbi:MAG: tripartite tricarboxylate transporter substrate binding protein [Oscillospiraceae bacterium]|nr:tripartite tricarboxylate transporter substrate binding protein [Oscillospiraceae bacterium]
MKKTLSLILALVLCAALAACGSSPASSGSQESAAPAPETAASAPESDAVDFPGGRTITMICPWSSGGGSDNGVRMLVPYLEKELGTSISVINPTGGSGWVGWEQMLSADVDGLTISLVNWPTLLPGYLDPSNGRNYNLDSFTLIANHVTDDGVIVINKDETRYTTAEEFFAYAKENEVTFGTTGPGTDDHILMEKINNALGTKLVQMPSKGWADNNAAIQGGHIDATAANVGEVANGYANGDLIVLCVFAEEENSLLPGVPTFNSLGLCEQSIVGSSQRGYAIKAGTDPRITAILEKAFEAAITDPEHVQKMADQFGLRVDFIGSAEYTAEVREQEAALIGMSDIMGW